jgi:hypothetical protein
VTVTDEHGVEVEAKIGREVEAEVIHIEKIEAEVGAKKELKEGVKARVRNERLEVEKQTYAVIGLVIVRLVVTVDLKVIAANLKVIVANQKISVVTLKVTPVNPKVIAANLKIVTANLKRVIAAHLKVPTVLHLVTNPITVKRVLVIIAEVAAETVMAVDHQLENRLESTNLQKCGTSIPKR